LPQRFNERTAAPLIPRSANITSITLNTHRRRSRAAPTRGPRPRPRPAPPTRSPRAHTSDPATTARSGPPGRPRAPPPHVRTATPREIRALGPSRTRAVRTLGPEAVRGRDRKLVEKEEEPEEKDPEEGRRIRRSHRSDAAPLRSRAHAPGEHPFEPCSADPQPSAHGRPRAERGNGTG